MAGATVSWSMGNRSRNPANDSSFFISPRVWSPRTRMSRVRRTIFDVLPRELRALHAVGRLDQATSGLLLLTNDSALSSFLTDPKQRAPPLSGDGARRGDGRGARCRDRRPHRSRRGLRCEGVTIQKRWDAISFGGDALEGKTAKSGDSLTRWGTRSPDCGAFNMGPSRSAICNQGTGANLRLKRRERPSHPSVEQPGARREARTPGRRHDLT